METQMDARKSLALAIVAFGIVALTLGLRTKQVDSEPPAVTEPPAKGNQLPTQSQSIQAMQDELAALRQSAVQPTDVAAEDSRLSLEVDIKNLEEQLTNNRAILDKAISMRRQREDESLIAAGFAPDRIEWIRQRSDELQTQWRKDQAERRRQGLPLDAAQEAAYYYDRDIGLRGEIGDDEYARYRLALGRSAGVAVAALTQGSPASRAGLLSGDDIVNYGGTRVFNLAELNALASPRDPGESVLIDVRRNGQTIQLVVPGGPLRIETKMPFPL